ncbi:MAG: succinate-semialdehyde dehydrogenase [Bacteroidetes bacterium 43-16]|nr:MAG: succinate-semialdehyde dehydrogenase [Bacteroidetes bacterium 43-16]
MLQSINPYTGIVIDNYKTDTARVIQEKIGLAHTAAQSWSSLSVKQRAAYLHRLAEYLTANKETMGRTATDEMGKPISQSIAELEKCAYTLQYYAENGEAFLKEEKIKTEASESFVTFEPLGTVLAIMPWNFPYWQVFRAMGPILISGNTMLLKHASNVTGCGQAIQQALDECGFPKGVFGLLQIKSDAVEGVIADPRVHAITFTGSTAAGKKVAAAAAGHLKKQVLELGGSDAYIILKDADLKAAAAVCAASRLNNTGQSCIAAKRMIVEEPIAAQFERLLLEAFEERPFGDPADSASKVGTMARMDLRDELHQQVEKSIALGAQVICGGYIPAGDAAFYPPTILSKVAKGMPAYEEELFGPVASIIVAKDEEEAIAIANDTEFGLGGAIFTSDLKKGKRLASKSVQAGSVFVNTMVSSNAKLPFGGIKQSGYGRELSAYGIKEFVNIKTVYIK